MRSALHPTLLKTRSYEHIMAFGESNLDYRLCCLEYDFWLTKIDQYDPVDRQSLFIDSVEKGYLNYIAILLNDPNVNPQHDNNYSIKYACRRSMNDVAFMLLDSGKVDPTTDHNYCISVAIINNNTQLVSKLLTLPGVDPTVHDSQFNPEEVAALLSRQEDASTSLLHIACSDHHNLDIVTELMNHPSIDPSINNNWAITSATTSGHHKMVEQLLRDSRVSVGMDDNYLLRYCVDHLDDNMLQLLLSHRDANPLASQGYPLMKCVRESKHATLGILCEDERVRHGDPLILQAAFTTACAKGDLTSVTLLINLVDPSYDNSKGLHLAQKGGHTTVVNYLLRDGRSYM